MIPRRAARRTATLRRPSSPTWTFANPRTPPDASSHRTVAAFSGVYARSSLRDHDSANTARVAGDGDVSSARPRSLRSSGKTQNTVSSESSNSTEADDAPRRIAASRAWTNLADALLAVNMRALTSRAPAPSSMR